MKKKFRQITVDGDDSWAWRVEDSKDKYYYNVSITIWKDKKVVYEKSFGYMCKSVKKYSITPGLISRFIKMYLVKELVS
jgi:regulator of protease activity HflC (stomatin/prohibitin superfamily)